MLKHVFSIFCLSLIFVACSTPPPRQQVAPPAPLNIRSELNAAVALEKSGDLKRATVRYRQLAQEHAQTDVGVEAQFRLGQIAFEAKNYEEAFRSYEAVVRSGIGANFLSESLVRGSRSLILGKRLNLVPEFTNLVALATLSPEVRREIAKLRYESFAGQGQSVEALQEIVSWLEVEVATPEQERARTLARDFIENKLSESELRDVGRKKTFARFRSAALYRLAQMQMDRAEFSSARNSFSEVVSLNDDPDLVEVAQQFITDIDARQRVDSKTIGVVLPLSGKNAAIGYKALRGIQLGLGIYGRVSSNFRLAVMDSEGNPDMAKRAIERLVIEDHVIAIIGGVLSRTASVEAARAQEFGVPAVMLSQKSGLTQIGESVFRNAVTSQMQVEYLVDIAIRQMGLSRFAILYPNDNYGTEFANLFWDEVLARGGQIVGAQSYDPKETDFRPQMQRLVGTFYIDDRMDEYRVRMRQWNEKNPRRSARTAPPAPEELLPPIVDFDGLFVPDTAKAVGQIAPFLAYSDVDSSKTRLLGTNLWRSGLVEYGKRYVENAVFIDSVLASDRTFQNSEFFNNFRQTFEEEPGLSEVQAYDSALILRQLIASGESSRLGLIEKLGKLKDFPGALGSLSVTSEREIKRALSALMVRDGKITPLNTNRN